MAIGHRQPPLSYPDVALDLLHCSPLPVLGSVIRSSNCSGDGNGDGDGDGGDGGGRGDSNGRCDCCAEGNGVGECGGGDGNDESCPVTATCQL